MHSLSWLRARGGMSIGACALGLAVAGSAFAAPAAGKPPASHWLKVNAAKKTATLIVIGAYNNVNSGYNFDGYAKGKLVFTVPVGWHVQVKCKNGKSATVNHSCAVTRNLNATKPAFPHAASKNPMTGITPGKVMTFSFVAKKPGMYRIDCLVPGHEQAGMWDFFKVVKGGKPSARLK